MTGIRRLAVALAAAGTLTFAAGASALPILDLLLPANAPGAVAQPATNITLSGAQLNGTVHPNGHGTKYCFEYGTTIAYGKKSKEVGISRGRLLDGGLDNADRSPGGRHLPLPRRRQGRRNHA